MEKNMYKFNKKFVWTVTIMLSVFMITFQSCAKEKPMSNVKTIQVVNFNLEGIGHQDYLGATVDVARAFNDVKGLKSKVWLSDEENNVYGGVYTWENRQAMEDYLNSDIYDQVLGSNPSFVNITYKAYDVLEEQTKITTS